MPTNPISEVLQHLRGLLRPDGAELTDGELPECFMSRREPAALEALVRRHGSMVWGVCRRVLGDHHDAEDAFQATFLVLVRKAASIRREEKVSGTDLELKSVPDTFLWLRHATAVHELLGSYLKKIDRVDHWSGSRPL